uniref:Ribosome production factor 2 homolog n=1 Tax=Panstrongylus lignarius TaxID=156445 RepID=A0A224XGQ7_9HEMI
MAVIQRIKKPTTRKGKKFLLNRESKVIENTKQSLFLRGRKGNEILTSCLRDLYRLKKPDALMLGGKHDILPFENTTQIEAFAKKYDSSLFFFGTHTKKRPNNLVLGRLYDNQILDMVELGIDHYQGLNNFDAEKITTGLKPCLIFAGPNFEQNPELNRIQNLLIDLFQRENANSVRLQGLEQIIMFTAADNKIFMRNYRILLKKSGFRTPRIELTEIGPSIDFNIRRMKLASEDFFKSACIKPKELKVKKKKNISRDAFGTKLGRVHVKQQDIHKLQTRKMKGLRKTAKEKRMIAKRKK